MSRSCARCFAQSALAELSFCEACDQTLAIDAKAISKWEADAQSEHWLFSVRTATETSMGGITAQHVGGTTHMFTPRGIWTHERDNPRTTRICLFRRERQGTETMVLVRDEVLLERIPKAFDPEAERDRLRRLDDGSDPIFASLP